MNLKQQRQEFYKLLEKLLEVKIPDDKLGYISTALKEYAQTSSENKTETIKTLTDTVEKLKDQIKKPVAPKPIKKEFKQQPDRIRVWTPNK